LRNIKSENAGGSSFCPSRANDMCKRSTRVICGLEFQTAKLAWVNEVVGCDNELESFGNYFFNKFAKYV